MSNYGQNHIKLHTDNALLFHVLITTFWRILIHDCRNCAYAIKRRLFSFSFFISDSIITHFSQYKMHKAVEFMHKMIQFY